MTEEQYAKHQASVKGGANVVPWEKVKAKQAKYKNVPTFVDGIHFDSKAEAKRYVELKTLEAAGDITDLKIHVRHALVVNGVKVGDYVDDFSYRRGNETVIEDVKGVKTPVYRLKKKIFEAIQPIRITEITK